MSPEEDGGQTCRVGHRRMGDPPEGGYVTGENRLLLWPVIRAVAGMEVPAVKESTGEDAYSKATTKGD
ncbi:hypothetical protein L2E82_25985 [Cichorium intybus]|uniref:Uncharacterized protein n=1 Tax=Cichorium intybus TaxID=13427 RepID=A0ACB9E5H5_CICIN|nr:hypothetical protein L2E82_25985 [Cichorium intybus]